MIARSGVPRARSGFHQAAWEEPLVMQLGRAGSRGVLLPDGGYPRRSGDADALAAIPAALRRGSPPRLPEVSQPEVLRHYERLSQMVLGNEVALNMGVGTCTMKFNPPVNEDLARGIAELHPLQDETTVQGILEILHRFEAMLRAISGLHRFSFQPSGGAHGVFTNALMIRAYHRSRGQDDQRTEILTTLFSHPCDGGTPATAGYKVVTIYPGPDGHPDLEAVRAAVSERTAGIMITNPEDTGLFNPRVKEITEMVHDAGGLCAYDQANANGILGVARAREAGFDMGQFNLHKTFGTPHACMGLACGPVGVTEELAPFLPSPTVEFDGERYYLDHDRPTSVGTIRAFQGNPQTVLKAYAWVMSLGAEGLREVANVAVLNNNYLARRIAGIRGASISFGEENSMPRLEQVRYSWERLRAETGVGTWDVERRMVDFGVQSYFTSHHPWVVPEPFTVEPAESNSKEDLDEFADVLQTISHEAYTDPEVVRTAPHRSTVARIVPEAYADPVLTWRELLRRGEAEPGRHREGDAGASRRGDPDAVDED